MNMDEIIDTTSEELDQAAGESGEVTFSQFMFSDKPEKFMLFRNVGDYTTHWMTPNGAWVPVPDDDEQAGKLIQFLADSDDLPTLA